MKKIILGLIVLLIIIVLAIIIFFSVFPKKYVDYISHYSIEYGVDSYIIASVINIESGYDSNSLSQAGAIGLMQLLPSTAFDMADRLDMSISEDDLYNEEINIKLGTFYLSYLLEIFNGNLTNTLASYNWGMQNVKNWLNKGNIDSFGNIIEIPVKETKDYLKKYDVNEFVYKNIYKV